MIPTSVTSFKELFTGDQLTLYLLISAINAVVLYFASMKFLLVLQLGGYHGKKYFKWLSNKDTPYMSRLMLLCLLCFLFFCVLNVCFSPLAVRLGGEVAGNSVASYLGFSSYLLFALAYVKTESSVNAKVPLKKTKRLVRLCTTYALVLFAVSFGFLTLLNYLAFVIGNSVTALLRYSLICIMPILMPYLLFVAYALNEPFEYVLRMRHLRIAKEKLAKIDVLKIAVTGSYGKTSVKEILKTILSQKYRILATPESYNTPLGIAISIKQLDSTHDVFIAEMGARSKGEIAELTKLVKPKYGVLTGINNQHLETFRSIKNIKDTKYELFENLAPDGVGFFCSDNDDVVELMQKFGGEKYSAGLNGENNLVTAKNVVTDERGMKFTLVFEGQKEVECSTVLLGSHSVKNICVAAAVAYKVGLSPEEIATGINRIKTIGHRLELMPNNKNIVIIDDSYNSNVTGVDAAMEVLDTFKGRKIVLTPGLVELGKMENMANLNFGRTLSQHADIVIIIGKHNAEMLINGLIDGGMSKENIKFAKNLTKGNAILNDIIEEGDVVLFENDLPDNYN